MIFPKGGVGALLWDWNPAPPIAVIGRTLPPPDAVPPILDCMVSSLKNWKLPIEGL
jgi:hypothetical protein